MDVHHIVCHSIISKVLKVQNWLIRRNGATFHCSLSALVSQPGERGAHTQGGGGHPTGLYKNVIHSAAKLGTGWVWQSKPVFESFRLATSLLKYLEYQSLVKCAKINIICLLYDCSVKISAWLREALKKIPHTANNRHSRTCMIFIPNCLIQSKTVKNSLKQ